MFLGPDDQLARRPSRIVVAGTSGSGKTTLSSYIAHLLGIAHIEIDSLFHGPDWTPREEFETDVDTFIARPAWVTEWNYGAVRDRVADRADLVIWLDLPRRTVMRQVVARTFRRRYRREVLWNGNIEPPLYRFFVDEKHILRWAWSTHGEAEARVIELATRRPELIIVRLQSRSAVARWAAGALLSSSALPPDL